jgi:hypothetical protein
MVLAKYMLRQHRSSLVDKTMSVLFIIFPHILGSGVGEQSPNDTPYHPVIYCHDID